MTFAAPPMTAAWEHRDARIGFEVLRTRRLREGWRLHGTTAAVEEGEAWVVDYVIEVDARWHTRRARVSHHLDGGPDVVSVEREHDRWLVDGRSAPELDGCLDVDLESSAMTNALPVHRLGLNVGETADVPAAYVRAADLTVDRLEQTYTRVADRAGRQCYDYAAPAFDFTARLSYDISGFVTNYPGLAVRRA